METHKEFLLSFIQNQNKIKHLKEVYSKQPRSFKKPKKRNYSKKHSKTYHYKRKTMNLSQDKFI